MTLNPKINITYNQQTNMAQKSQMMAIHHLSGKNQLQNNMTHFQLNKNDQLSLSKTYAYTQNPNHGQNFALNNPYVNQQVTNQPGKLFSVIVM